MSLAAEYPGYPFGWIRDYLEAHGVTDAMSDVEAESAYLSHQARLYGSVFVDAGGDYVMSVPL